MNRFIIPAIAMALLVPLSGFAGQDKSHDGNCVSVKTAGFDKNDSSSRDLMYANLKKAVREVCGATDIRNAGSLLQAVNNRHCTEEKLFLATQTVGSDALGSLDRNEQQGPLPSSR